MKVGLIICTYNRPEYLRQCLESVAAADIPENVYLVPIIVDDASTDMQTKELVFHSNYNIICKAENKSIKDSMLQGCDWIIDKVDLIINLDGDAIVRKDFLSVLLELKRTFPDNIITGFNCLTKNRDGSERHKVLTKGIGFNTKKSVGGINMVFDKRQYNDWIRPALVECLQTQGNWDHKACLRSEAAGFPIVCAVPSVVQHIGIDSAMGHSKSEPPDVADDFSSITIKNRSDGVTDYGIFSTPAEEYSRPEVLWQKLQLKDVTLIGADCVDIDRLIKAADKCCANIDFGAVKLLSSLPSIDPRVIKIRPLFDKKEYSQFVLKEIVNYVTTDYMLIFQYDGFVLNPSAWDDEFLKYDMVGASWKFRPEKRTANGGFSLRSKRMMEAIRDDESIYLQNDHIIKNFAEDHVLFYIYREYLEKEHGVKIAPEELCDKFAIEAWGVKDNKYKGSFGFHGFSVDFSDAQLPYVPYLLPSRQIL